MNDITLLKRITVNPQIFGGKPIIRGIRIKVENILALLEQGMTPEEILAEYPDLEIEDIRGCLAYARALVANETVEAIDAEASR
ncbi:hypothetical protein SY88_02765 [Clostridiales bacterium PH28_bin88]|nr:hypothetical protein SY88_02765 [Clostridiales bacterium PH28_bin88]